MIDVNLIGAPAFSVRKMGDDFAYTGINRRMTELTGLCGQGRVHVLCASGGRAALAADTLRAMGYDATLIEGGLAAWKANGLPVEG